MTDEQIVQQYKIKPIEKIAAKLGLKKKDLVLYGHCAKIVAHKKKKAGKLILVTATNPTDAGIGKTTVSIGLSDALSKVSKACVVLREPSLGPVMGRKGCATGGGKAQVVPSTINLHFTGDMHAVTSANNLLCAMIDNSMYQGNALDIQSVVFHRCLDMNDRALRDVTLANGRKESFVITPASEIMAVMCLAKDLKDLKRRLGNVIIGYNSKHEPITAKDLKAVDAMTLLLKQAFEVNLAQTLEGTPALIHLGPFANIAHGCNSVRATQLGLDVCDYVVTECGFGSDLGMEKFLDVKSRVLEHAPDCIVLVTTLKSIFQYGNTIEEGFAIVEKHIDNIVNIYNLPLVVTINVHDDDKNADLDAVVKMVKRHGVDCELNYAYTNGSIGTNNLARKVILAMDSKKKSKLAYAVKDTLQDKIEKIATKVYGARGVVYQEGVLEKLNQLQSQYGHYAVMIAKTPKVLSDNEKTGVNIRRDHIRYTYGKYDESKGFDVIVTDVEVKGGAEFVVVYMGNILCMPGLNKTPNATKIVCTDTEERYLF